MQIVERFNVVANANSFAGLQIQTPYVNSVNGGSADGSNFQIPLTTGTALSPKWSNGTTEGLSIPFAGVADIKAMAQSARVVSAQLIVQCEASGLANSGEMVLFNDPFAETAHDSGFTYNHLQNMYKSTTIPLNANRPGTVRWYPMYKNEQSFKNFVLTEESNFVTFGDSDQCPFWYLGFVATAPAGTSFSCTMVVNYEFIPRYNTLNILNASPSPQDAMETDLVENWVQDLNVAAPTSTRQASSSPSAVEPSHEGSETFGFGMLYNILEVLGPIALGML